MSHSNLLLPDFFAALIDKYCCKTAVASGENINRISAENCASLESPWNSTAAATVFETRGKKLMLSAQLALSSPQGEFHWVVEVALVEKCPLQSKKRWLVDEGVSPGDNCIAPFDFRSGASYDRIRKEQINRDWMLDAVLMGCFDFM